MIPVERETVFGGEPCAFCWRATIHWDAVRPGPEQVAVCHKCAQERDPSELPTKAAWCASVAARYFPKSARRARCT